MIIIKINNPAELYYIELFFLSLGVPPKPLRSTYPPTVVVVIYSTRTTLNVTAIHKIYLFVNHLFTH